MNILSKNALFLLMLILLSTKTFSQKAFILTKDNQKIVMDDSLITVSHWDKKIEYNELGTKKRKKIKFDVVQNMEFGNYHLKPFPIEDKNEGMLYFTIVETEGKKLIGYSKKIDSDAMGLRVTKYYYFIIDDNNKILETLEFDDNYGDKWAKKRDGIEVILRKHFSDCPEFIGRLREHDTKAMDLKNSSKMIQKFAKRFDEGNAKVFMLFENPRYSKCNDTTNQVVLDVPNDTIGNSQYDGTYKYGVINIAYGPGRSDFKIAGVCIVKDGTVELANKDASVKYKIKGVKDGNIYCLDRDMIHVLRIEPESGKNRGFTYDTKITLKLDKGMGDSINYYYSIKQ